MKRSWAQSQAWPGLAAVLSFTICTLATETYSLANPFPLPVGSAPRSLQMRASAWRIAPPPKQTNSEEDQASIFSRTEGEDLNLGSAPLDRMQTRKLAPDLLPPKRRLSDKVVFRFNLGVGLEGGEASGRPMLSGASLDTRSYEELRIYSFGDAAIGTHDLGFSGLNTYIAAHFQRNQNSPALSAALPSIYDGNFQQPLVRSAYGEVDQFFSHPLLRPIHVRAGRSFQYGLSVIQFDGVNLGYDTRVLKINIFSGQRVNHYSLGSDDLHKRGVLSGGSLRIDLYQWRKWPLLLFANSLRFDKLQHLRTGMALRWNRDVLLSGSVRTIDGSVARTGFSLRARLSDVTTINLALTSRTRSDWSFGLLQLRTPDNATDPRRYLDLGPVLPKILMSARYGTVLLRNLDIIVRASGAVDRRNEEEQPATSFAASYIEGGGGLEVHARRSLRLGLAASTRRYFLQDKTPISRVIGAADPLPINLGATGVRSFWEGGLNFVYSPGAREFSASAELYGRRYQFRSEYFPESHRDWRSGGRFSLEGWTFEQIRLKTEYDVSFGGISFAPELGGLKSLRVLMEGSF